MSNLITKADLIERQKWTLHQKIDHALGVIDQFISRLDGKVYVSFSGGKDSTVLLDLCRVIKPDIKAVFCNTGNEYPDIVRFVRELKNTEGYNIEIIYPQIKPKEVLAKHGFPLVSKETAEIIHMIRHSPNSVKARRARGELDCKWKSSKIPEKYEYLISAPYDVTHKCCYFLKKKPFRQYTSKTGLHPLVGTMACESQARTSAYIRRGGCNSFDHKVESAPLSIWLEDDVWEYIKERQLPIADIYNKGAKRTGCMFCGFGCMNKEDDRFELLHSLYPKCYDTFMSYRNNDVTYKEALSQLLNIFGKQLPA